MLTRIYGDPVLVRPRLGQGTFRVLVTDNYRRRCAVTGEKALPVLDAAHINDQRIWMPGDPISQPNREALAWHSEEVFLG